ncbi:hypothetical protein SSS_07454 [Sarcoptes scabiei]|nr:hypothetical protein SSS_07454 [Sarcoptes scabiei]
MKMDARISLVIGLFLLAESAYTQPANQNHPTLRGLTSLRSPFVEKDIDGKLKGYFVDLLDELASVGHFNYTLTDSASQDNPNDGFQNRPTGLINDVYRNVSTITNYGSISISSIFSLQT